MSENTSPAAVEPNAAALPADDVAAIDELRGAYDRLAAELGKVIVGQKDVIEQLCICLFARGHALLMGVPGLAKTLLISKLAETMSLSFSRIQFTPDLMPMDITGTDILQDQGAGKRSFEFAKGPVFANIVLADEINRAPAKTQAAMLEAMQEHRVTVAGRTYTLDSPFFVLATQNPIEQEGTYPLPEAQLDRFLFKLDVHSNDAATLEKIVLHREIGVEPEVAQVIDADGLNQLLDLVRRVFMPQPVANFIARLVHGTQPGQTFSGGVKFGASPRAALALAAAAKARALMEGRLHAAYEDVRAIAGAVLRHRLLLDYGAKLEGITPDGVIARLVENIPAQEKPLPGSLSAAKI